MIEDGRTTVDTEMTTNREYFQKTRFADLNNIGVSKQDDEL